jgi:hypothetical protein
MSTRDDDKRDYEVGYGRPPKSGQFQKGQSGNPKGRPKGAKGFKASLKRELASEITVREGNRVIRIAKHEAAAKRLVEKALNGDLGAIRMLAAIDAEFSQEVEAAMVAEVSSRQPEPGDLEILRHFAQMAQAGEWCPDEGEEDA